MNILFESIRTFYLNYTQHFKSLATMLLACVALELVASLSAAAAPLSPALPHSQLSQSGSLWTDNTVRRKRDTVCALDPLPFACHVRFSKTLNSNCCKCRKGNLWLPLPFAEHAASLAAAHAELSLVMSFCVKLLICKERTRSLREREHERACLKRAVHSSSAHVVQFSSVLFFCLIIFKHFCPFWPK